ncbi:MAG: serine hydrolase domain-containing protein [Caulobacteraceae bacterium]
MRSLAIVLLAVTALVGAAAPANAADNSVLRKALRLDLDRYLRDRGAVEHISAASLSVSLADHAPDIDVVAGTTAFRGATPITPSSLFEIGSNTKSFTAALILQLEAEHRLSISDTVGKWLPQYPAWRAVTIRRLLDMTSGIVGYDAVSAMLADLAKAPHHVFTAKELVAYAYPKDGAPPSNHRWAYSNTNYILAQLIVEKATGHTYADELARRLIGPVHGLADTHYADSVYPPAVTTRMVSGYFYSTDPDNAPLKPIYGDDVRGFSVSWMQAAGGIVATPAQVVRWVRNLYRGATLAPAQRRELLSIVSVSSGKPIASTDLADPRGFGLGVAQMTSKTMGVFWYYEGETLGYRTLYAYLPRQNAVIAVGLNSQANTKDDHIGQLMETLYGTLHAAGKL